jgi:hypothetical protein
MYVKITSYILDEAHCIRIMNESPNILFLLI